MGKAIKLLQPISSNLSEISYIIETCRFFLMKWLRYLYMGRIVVRWWTFIPSPSPQHYRFPVSLDSFINLFIWQIFIELCVRHCLECWGVEENEVVSIHKDLSSVRERGIQQINIFLMWIILKVFIELVSISFLFCVLVFCPEALEGEVLTTGTPGKLHDCFVFDSVFHFFLSVKSLCL